MAAQKPLQIVSGVITEVVSVESSAGSGDEGKIVALNAAGQIDVTMLPDAVTTSITSSEAIAAGSLINIWSSTGTKVRNADNAAIGKQCHGYAPAAISSGVAGTVVLTDAIISGLSSLTVGTQYFLGSAGAVTATAPTASASIVQSVGVAISTTSLALIVGTPIVRA